MKREPRSFMAMAVAAAVPVGAVAVFAIHTLTVYFLYGADVNAPWAFIFLPFVGAWILYVLVLSIWIKDRMACVMFGFFAAIASMCSGCTVAFNAFGT